MWTSRAPSNIALIKYMGKTTGSGNTPANSSLSFTLDHLVTEVRIEESHGADSWLPLAADGFSASVGEKGQRRFLEFFSELKKQMKIGGQYSIQSGNNFPSDCGLASSASSFAALTRATYELAKDRGHVATLSAEDLSRISRAGSGSSCRSFFSPWALWRSEGAERVELPIETLIHLVAIVDAERKSVSSSEAHKRIESSPLFKDRPRRAEDRLEHLLHALREMDWRRAYEICWQEFQDMHTLFETSDPPFGYMNAGSLRVLDVTRAFWESEKDGPIVTMDAGANVHLLFRPDQSATAAQLKEILESEPTTWVMGNDIEGL